MTRRVLVRIHTAERHGDSAEALTRRLQAAWAGTEAGPGDVRYAEPFRSEGPGDARQFAVCSVRREIWDVLVHGALWVPFAEQGLERPEVFGEEDGNRR